MASSSMELAEHPLRIPGVHGVEALDVSSNNPFRLASGPIDQAALYHRWKAKSSCRGSLRHQDSWGGCRMWLLPSKPSLAVTVYSSWIWLLVLGKPEPDSFHVARQKRSPAFAFLLKPIPKLVSVKLKIKRANISMKT